MSTIAGPGPSAACAAPWSGLYFRPDGVIAVCCGTWHPIGRADDPDRPSLRAIWEGGPAQLQRDALAQGDHGLGCWECGNQAAAGHRGTSLAAEFDRYLPIAEPVLPVMLDFALSNRCNLACTMCNGGLSSTIRQRREGRPALPLAYDDRFFAELDELLPTARRLQFKGGEPFLTPENERIWARLGELGGDREVSITTNGTVWNERVERWIHDLDPEVIVSVDAIDPAVLEAVRVGVRADRLWATVDALRASVRPGALSLSMCLMVPTWQELAPFLARCNELDVHASVIWVDGPASFRLLGAGRDVLEKVAATWDRADRSVQALRPDLRRWWDDARSRVDAALEARPATPVALRTGDGSTATDATARLRRRTSGPLLELVYRDQVIDEVIVPSWAEPLEPARWKGRGLDETVAVLAGAVDGALRSEVRPLDHGVHELELRVERAEGPGEHLRALYLPADDEREEGRLLGGRASADA
ncbi:MAG: radical SAM protein [Acidimicrobiales bacterium]